MEIQNMIMSTARARIDSSQFEAILTLTSTSTTNPFSGHLKMFGKNSPSGYSNPEISELLNLAAKTIDAEKKDDLYKKYSIKVTIEPCTVMLIKTSAIKIFYRLSVGRDTTTLSLLYNPVTKSIDPLVCMACKESITNVHFCDALHLLCSSCHTKCPVCTK